MTQEQFLDFLAALSAYIDGDRVTAEDDEALEAIAALALYIPDHMVPDDFTAITAATERGPAMGGDWAGPLRG